MCRVEWLHSLESAEVRQTQRAWFSTAERIMCINSNKLYTCVGVQSLNAYFDLRATHDVFGFGRSQAENYMSAYRVQKDLPSDLPIALNAGVLRPLVRVPKDQRGNIWKLTHDIATSQNPPRVVTRGLVDVIVRSIHAQDGCYVKFNPSRVCIDVWFSAQDTKWYLDDESVDDVNTVLQHIHLDAASDLEADTRIQADRIITEHEDASNPNTNWAFPEDHPLHGIPLNVLLNAPGGVSRTMQTKAGSNSLQGILLERAIHEYEVTKTIGNALIHLRAAVGHVWFDKVYEYPHCWLKRHIKFYNPSRGEDFNGSSCHGSVWVFLGRDHHTYQRFLDVFGRKGYIPGHNAWCSKVPKLLLVTRQTAPKEGEADAHVS